jgi:hypothetical protein
MMQNTLAVLALLSNLILVGITAWYAWQTHQTVLEMQEARRAVTRPHIRLDLATFGSGLLTRIENVGTGPALDVVATASLRDDAAAVCESIEWNTPVLRAGESRLLLLPKGDRSFQALSDAGMQLALSGTCKSVSGEALGFDDTIVFASATRNEVTISSSTDVSERLKKIVDELAGIRKAMR